MLTAACGSDDPSGEGTTTTTVPATTTSSTTTTTSTTTTVPAIDQYVRVYFMVDDVGQEAGPFIRPVIRQIAPTVAVARAALNELIAGPTPDEMAGIPAIHGGLPDGTRLLGLTIRDGTAWVDLSGEIENVGGTFGEMSVLAQLVFTLTQFPTVDDVVLMIDGTAVEFYGGHGMEVAPSMNRDYFLGSGMVPEILIDSPAFFETTGSPLLVKGIGRLFEAAADWALYDNDGLPLAEGFTMASTGGPEWGTFQFGIPYDVDREQLGALMMWEVSAEDGSRLHLVEHPVWLTP
jgi:spore germination protein GerM